jgi:hypothetical protein
MEQQSKRHSAMSLTDPTQTYPFLVGLLLGLLQGGVIFPAHAYAVVGLCNLPADYALLVDGQRCRCSLCEAAQSIAAFAARYHVARLRAVYLVW